MHLIHSAAVLQHTTKTGLAVQHITKLEATVTVLPSNCMSDWYCHMNKLTLQRIQKQDGAAEKLIMPSVNYLVCTAAASHIFHKPMLS